MESELPLKQRMELNRWIITGSLLTAAYITATCPCKPFILSCHQNEFFGLVGFSLAYTYYINN